jgi:MFS family permease
MLKTIYVSTNSVIATAFNCSYMAAAAFTGLPFMFAAASSVGTSILSQAIGKRAIYVASGLLMLAGALWNMHIASSYAAFMVSRIFQGIGWGACEGLIVVSIRDIYFVRLLSPNSITLELTKKVNERGLRMYIHNITTLIFTWGSPIVLGNVSQSNEGFRNALMVVTVIQAFSILFLIILVPETSFSRQFNPDTSTNYGVSNQISGPTPSAVKSYLTSLHPVAYRGAFSLQAGLKPLRAIGAPTTLLTFVATFPLIAASHGIANSLSLLYAGMPTFIFPTRLGFIFILPLLLSLFSLGLISIVSRFQKTKSPSILRMSEIVPGILLGASGLVGLGIYTGVELGSKTLSNGVVVYDFATSMMFSLKVVSALFGMLVAGSVVLSYAASKHLSSFSSMPENESDRPLETGHQFWQSIFSGIFIMAIPVWAQMGSDRFSGLKDMSIGLAVTQIILGSTVGAIMSMKSSSVEQLDERIMGISRLGVGGSMELKGWKSNDSFFEA